MAKFDDSYYKGYLKKKKEQKQNRKIKKAYEKENKNIIVIRQKWWVTIFYILANIFKFLLYIAIIFLLSLGATILVNAEIRNMLFSNLIKNFL